MRDKKVFLDSFLVVVGIVGTLFLVYCAGGTTNPTYSRVVTPSVSIFNENFNACEEEFPISIRKFTVQFSENMSSSSVSNHVEVSQERNFTISPVSDSDGKEYNLEFLDDHAYDTEYSITVTAGVMTARGVSINTDYTYTFRTRPQAPPFITRTRPEKSDILVSPTSPLMQIHFSEPMSESSVIDHLTVSSPGTSTHNSWFLQSDRGEHILYINFDEDLLYDTEYTASVSVGTEDAEGETLQSDFNLSFRTYPDTTRSFVNYVRPAPGSLNVPRKPLDARIFFDSHPVGSVFDVYHEMFVSIESVQSEVTIKDELDDPVNFTIDSITPRPTGNAKYFDIVFNELLDGNTTYTVTIPSDILDSDGNSLYSSYIFSFTTEAASQPFVVQTQPSNGDTGVPRTIDAVVEFSEFMSELSVESSISVAPSTGASFSWNQCSDVLTASFSPDLAYSTLYTVTVGSNAKDEQWERLETPYTFAFTTVQPTRPEVVNTSPADGATDVWWRHMAWINFSKEMDTSSTYSAITITPRVFNNIAWSSSKKVFYVTFPNGLDFGTEYVITISTDALDTEGYALVSDYTYSFTTQPPCFAACDDYSITLSPDQPIYDLDQPLTFNLISGYEITPCIEDVTWFHNGVLNQTQEMLTGHLITSMAGTNTFVATTSGLSQCTVTLDYYVEPLCPSSCSAITFDQPADSAQFLAGDEFSLALGGSTACIENVIYSSDADGVLGSGNITSLLTSLSTTTTHTITAQVVSTGMATCDLTKTVSVLDCPVTCGDMSLTEPSSTQYLLGEDVPYALSGNTLCVEEVLWDLTGDSQALTTGLSGTLADLGPGGYTISADVKSTLLATCLYPRSFTVLPCPSACGQYSMPLPAGNEHFSGDTVTFTLEAAGAATFDCADNIIWESDIDGLLDSGQGLNSISVSDLSSDTHTIIASIVSSTLETCTVQRTVTILDCPGDCYDITFDLPTESTFNFGNSITFGLGGRLDCVQNVMWSSDADGPLGSGPVLTSLTTSALSITTHTITAEVKSYNLATCDKTKPFQILPFMGSNYFPDTGQTTCYDDTHALQASSCPAVGDTFYGQDATYINPPPAMSLVANGDSTVTDNNTGLTWQQGYNGGFDHLWQSAVDACNSLSLAGTNSWRLPSRREMMNITDFGEQYPALNTTVFDYLFGMEPYWTATTSAASGSDAWFVDAGLGHLGADHKTMPVQLYEAYSRCVLGDPLPAASLTNNGDSTVTDSVANLMWQDGIWATASTITWDMALEYCEDLSLAGHTDWKLPDIRELESLVDTAYHSPAIDAAAFSDASHIGDVFWSSTTAGLAQDAWTINFGTGGTGTGTKSSLGFKIYVRCVRLP